MTETEGKYLAIKNWEKYQPSYTSKKRARWIKSWVDKYDDPDYHRLSAFQRHILDGIRDLRGKLGKNPPNDDHYISNALALHRGERTNVRRTLDHLLTIGFLLLCNQQMDVTTLNLDKSRVDKNRIETTKACRKPKPLAPIVELPEGIKRENWDAFVLMRKSIKKPLTEHGSQLAINKLCQFRARGYDPNEILNESTMNCWQGLFEPKNGGNGNGKHRETSEEKQRRLVVEMLAEDNEYQPTA